MLPNNIMNANTEDMLARDPDIILRTSHALPDEVMAMFAQEFSTNDIWKHFRAVKEQRVYDLAYDRFGMSATFAYPQALFDLRAIFYEHAHGTSGNQAKVLDAQPRGTNAQADGTASPANGADISPHTDRTLKGGN